MAESSPPDDRRRAREDMISQGVLLNLAARARSLDDRRDAAGLGSRRASHAVTDERRRNRWLASSARGVEADFARRLDCLGLADPADLSAVLADTELAPPKELPAWLEILLAASQRRGLAENAGDEPASGHELDALLAPLLDEAEDRLMSSSAVHTMSDTATSGLRDGLRADLSRLLGPCVDAELAAFRALSGQPTPADLWQRFQRKLVGSGLFGLWSIYPVLARLVGVRLLDWVDRSAELARRFESDRPALAVEFGLGDSARLDCVELAGSDPHNGHAAVSVCTVNGRRLVYKPKDLSAEVLWSELLHWANRVGIDLGAPIKVLARDGYGWAGYVDQLPTDADGAGRYYCRIGRLAALLFALGGNDAQAENVIACADTPVIIDTETLLQPSIPVDGDDDPGPQWVLDSLLLPRWLRIGGLAVDLSATGAPGGFWQRTELRWHESGKPAMELTPVRVRVTEFPSALRCHSGSLYRPEHFGEQIESGFRHAWQQIASHATDFTRPGGWLDRFAEVEVRVLLRLTRTYSRLLDTALDPELMRSGIDRSIHLDHVARAAFDRNEPGWLELTSAERSMLEDGDVPFFSVRADQQGLAGNDGADMVTFAESSVARARRRLTDLSEVQLQRQTDLIRSALAVAPADCRSKSFAAQRIPPFAKEFTDPAVAAAEIAARIRSQVRTFGGPQWPLGLVAASPSQWSIDVPGPGLYDGRLGLAVALSAASTALKDEALGELANEIASHVAQDALTQPRRLLLRYGIGGQDGVGGMMLGFALMQRMSPTADLRLGAAFASLAGAVREADLKAANPTDLLGGLPGFVAGLQAGATVGWHDATEVESTGRQLLLDLVSARLEAVRSGSAEPMNGFSHGDAGLAAVLAALARSGGECSDVAGELSAALVAAESARFEPQLGGWRDLRQGADNSGPGPGWCNGHAGIALSRLLVGQCLSVSPGSWLPALRHTIETDLSRIEPREYSHNRLARDTLCCGAAGNLAVLQTVLSTVPADQRETWRSVSESMTSELGYAALQGQLRIGVPAGSPLAPLGLFQGLGGVLYALALASRPGLPSVLAWGTDLSGDPSGAQSKKQNDCA